MSEEWNDNDNHNDNLNANKYRKRYGRKRRHSRATEAMDGNYGSRLMVHGARVKVDAECFKGNGSNLECEYTEKDLIFLNY